MVHARMDYNTFNGINVNVACEFESKILPSSKRALRKQQEGYFLPSSASETREIEARECLCYEATNGLTLL